MSKSKKGKFWFTESFQNVTLPLAAHFILCTACGQQNALETKKKKVSALKSSQRTIKIVLYMHQWLLVLMFWQSSKVTKSGRNPALTPGDSVLKDERDMGLISKKVFLLFSLWLEYKQHLNQLNYPLFCFCGLLLFWWWRTPLDPSSFMIFIFTKDKLFGIL